MIVDGEDITIYAVIIAAVFFSIGGFLLYFAVKEGLIWLLRLPKCVKVEGYMRRAANTDGVIMGAMDRVVSYSGDRIEQVFYDAKNKKEIVIDVTALKLRKRRLYAVSENQTIKGWYHEKTNVVFSLFAVLRLTLIFGIAAMIVLRLAMVPTMSIIMAYWG